MPSLPSQYRFPLLFLLFYRLLQWLYFTAPESIIRDFFVIALTVEPSAWFIGWLWPDLNVAADGTRVTSIRGNVNVLRGCEGTETMLLLLAALLASLRPWGHIIIGAVAGLTLVYAVNQIRIAMLFWTTVYHGDRFELMHGTITPIIVIGVSLLFFIGWIKASEILRPN